MKLRHALLIALLLAACSKATPENYAKIEAGMTREEVYAVLGKPDEVSGGGIGSLTTEAETWKGSGHTIHLRFVSGKLIARDIETTGSQ